MLELEAIIIGPTLEELDNWGDLDSLPWSLDSEVWLNAKMLKIAGSDSQAGNDDIEMIEVLDFISEDDQPAHDNAILDLHFFPHPIDDNQPAHDSCILTVLGWEWVQVPQATAGPWKRVN